VPFLAQLVGERAHSVGQPLHVVVEQNFGHLDLLSLIDPLSWNIRRC
jgi:hypothetical protein